MTNLRNKLFAGVGAVTLMAAPALATNAFAQANVDTMTGTSAAAGAGTEAGTGNLGTSGVDTTGTVRTKGSTTKNDGMDNRSASGEMRQPAQKMGATMGGGSGMSETDVAEERDDLATRGYSGVEVADNAIAAHDQIAFNAVDPRGNPVRLIVDRDSGVVVREKEMRTLPTQSKNQ